MNEAKVWWPTTVQKISIDKARAVLAQLGIPDPEAIREVHLYPFGVEVDWVPGEDDKPRNTRYGWTDQHG